MLNQQKWLLDRTDTKNVLPLRDDLIHKLIIEGELRLYQNNSPVEDPFNIDSRMEICNWTNRSWDTINFDLHMKFDEEECSILDVSDPSDKKMIYISINCDKTKYQKNFVLPFVEPVTHLDFKIRRENLYDYFRLSIFVLLNNEKEKYEDYAYAKGSILASACEIVIITDITGNPFGGRIEEKYEKFEGKIAKAIFRVSIITEQDSERPCIYWNTRYSNMISLIQTPIKEGTNFTLMRDFLIHFVAYGVMFELLNKINDDTDYEFGSLGDEIIIMTGKALGLKDRTRIKNYIYQSHELYSDCALYPEIQSYMSVGEILEKLLIDREGL